MRYTKKNVMRPHVLLAPFTSLAVGGPAERLYTSTTNEELDTLLSELGNEPLWVLGYGANVLISDKGLPGTTILVRTNGITKEATALIADAGVWWDDLVQFSIQENLWGLELMSAIPGGVGAAIVGNIAAYGQAVADTLAWVEVFDRVTKTTRRLQADDLAN
jgi:UDP-N-acetylmuramate dehydrogenase